jgi:hypothetical protein
MGNERARAASFHASPKIKLIAAMVLIAKAALWVEATLVQLGSVASAPRSPIAPELQTGSPANHPSKSD